MPAGAARGNLRVLRGHAAEGDEQARMPGQHVPRRVADLQLRHRRDDVRHHDVTGAEAVGIDVAHIAAAGIQEAVHLALRMVEAPGAGPAVGAAEDCGVAVGVAHAGDLPRDQVEGAGPIHLHEVVLTAPLRRRTRTVPQPAPPHGRARDAQAHQLVVELMQSDRRRIGIAGQHLQPGRSRRPVLDLVDAPVGTGVARHVLFH